MRVFVTGASGYIGGSIAARLLAAGHVVRGLVRSEAKAGRLRASGIEPVPGSLDDAALLRAEAAAADAVVNAASSDHAGAARALMDGLEGTGRPFLHTSGTSIVADDAQGEPSDRVFTEDTPFTPPPLRAARVALDQEIRAAAGRGIRTVVLCNGLIYGRGLGLHADSVQVPSLIELAKAAGVPRHIGRGRNVWSNVHIADVAELYLRALEAAEPGAFFFVENGAASFREMAQAIGRMLGLGERTEPWPIEAAVALWGESMARYTMGSNSRVRADRARDRLGWRPRHDSVTREIERGWYAAQHGGGAGLTG
jgi:nucleoside-diphosphate-sugar epimerase